MECSQKLYNIDYYIIFSLDIHRCRNNTLEIVTRHPDKEWNGTAWGRCCEALSRRSVEGIKCQQHVIHCQTLTSLPVICILSQSMILVRSQNACQRFYKRYQGKRREPQERKGLYNQILDANIFKYNGRRIWFTEPSDIKESTFTSKEDRQNQCLRRHVIVRKR